MAAQAGYASSGSGYGGQQSSGSSLAGIAVQFRPAATLTVLPSQAGGYGAAPASSYGAAPAPSYAAAPAPSYSAAPAPASYGGASASYGGGSAGGAGGIDGGALRLANLVWALPSPGGPSGAILNVPQFATTAYTAPGVVFASGHPGNAVNGAAAAAAASSIKTASSGYGPAPAPASAATYGASSGGYGGSSAGSGYGAAPAASSAY